MLDQGPNPALDVPTGKPPCPYCGARYAGGARRGRKWETSYSCGYQEGGTDDGDLYVLRACVSHRLAISPSEMTTDPAAANISSRSRQRTRDSATRDERARIERIIEAERDSFDGCNHHSDYAIAEEMQRAVYMVADSILIAIRGGDHA